MYLYVIKRDAILLAKPKEFKAVNIVNTHMKFDVIDQVIQHLTLLTVNKI